MTIESARRIVFLAPGKVNAELYRPPALAPGQFLVRNRYSLISPGTELAQLDGTQQGVSGGRGGYPCFPGYCSIGRVIAKADNVTKVAIGQTILHLGRHEDLVLVDEESGKWLLMPQDEPRAEFLLARFYQIAWTAIYVGNGIPEKCCISGAGLLGICAAGLLRSLGTSEIVVMTASSVRAKVVEACGIRARNRRSDDLRELKYIVETTGRGGYITDALDRLATMGTLILLGSPRSSIEIDLYSTVHRNAISVIGAHERVVPFRCKRGGLDRQTMMYKALEMIKSGCLPSIPLVHTMVSPETVGASYAALRLTETAGPTVVIDWGDGQDIQAGERH